MSLPKLSEVRTYNPLQFGITYDHFNSLNPEGKIAHYNGIQRATLEYSVAPKIIFSDVLFGKGGYFETHPEIHSIIMVNGRLAQENKSDKDLRNSLDALLKNNKEGVIPVYFLKPKEPKELSSPLVPFIPAPIHIPTIEELAA
ncbi:MAG: hypothetical protein Q8Q31_04335 [Nanoarchaeota archaeon]|nr:hypothetical protein [Nanoarchaeota archaeon]